MSDAWSHLRAWRDRDDNPIPRPYPLPTQSVDVSAELAAHPTTGADYSANPLRWLYCGGAGTVYLQLLEDSSTRAFEVIAGLLLPGVIVCVGAATTASGLVGLR